jgi:hypothetical protein
MICTVLVCKPLAMDTKVFLHQRRDDELFADGVSNDFPAKLAGPTALSIGVAGALDVLVVVGIHLQFYINNGPSR